MGLHGAEWGCMGACLSLPACTCVQLPSLGLCALSGSAWAEHSAGDFNLALLDELIAEPRLQMISCCNELNAGCAARGRMQGGALLILWVCRNGPANGGR